jgi:phage-related protein
LEYIDSLPEQEKVDGYSVLSALENDEFNKVNYKRWKKKIYEVYFYKNNRVFYVIGDSDNLYLLHACRKQKNKTEKKDCKIVEQRARELGKLLGKKLL